MYPVTPAPKSHYKSSFSVCVDDGIMFKVATR